jgi:hypothetical protein
METNCLLYTGPIVLNGTVSKEVYEYFLALSVAVSILHETNREWSNTYLDYVSELLELFVKTVSICIVIHSQCTMYTLFFNGLMMPITSTASSLNELSFFPFENYMQQLKVTIRETLL